VSKKNEAREYHTTGFYEGFHDVTGNFPSELAYRLGPPFRTDIIATLFAIVSNTTMYSAKPLVFLPLYGIQAQSKR
jgi:hypothetical protein